MPLILLIFALGITYVGQVNKNLIKDCNASIQEYINPSWGPGSQGEGVQKKIICEHNLRYNLNLLP